MTYAELRWILIATLALFLGREISRSDMRVVNREAARACVGVCNAPAGGFYTATGGRR